MLTGKLVLKTTDANLNTFNNTISDVNGTVISLADGAGWKLLDRTARSLVGLTTNTYQSAQFVLTYNVDEEVEKYE